MTAGWSSQKLEGGAENNPKTQETEQSALFKFPNTTSQILSRYSAIFKIFIECFIKLKLLDFLPILSPEAIF